MRRYLSVRTKWARWLCGLSLAAALQACGPAPTATGINDPYEADNRKMHAFNKNLDQAFLSGGAEGYSNVVPEPVRRGVGNFTSNADMPRMVVNDVLQGNVEDAVHNTFRFLVNTTFGIAGLLDPAADMGLTARDTDFGETLHVWGFAEGRYLELPVIGPSTERDAAGKLVDLALNPLHHHLQVRDRNRLRALTFASQLDDRARFSDTIESILYESADSYAQARLLYLQNRRFQLGGEEGVDYADPYDDPYFDPYEDPNVQQ